MLYLKTQANHSHLTNVAGSLTSYFCTAFLSNMNYNRATNKLHVYQHLYQHTVRSLKLIDVIYECLVHKHFYLDH